MIDQSGGGPSPTQPPSKSVRFEMDQVHGDQAGVPMGGRQAEPQIPLPAGVQGSQHPLPPGFVESQKLNPDKSFDPYRRPEAEAEKPFDPYSRPSAPEVPAEHQLNDGPRK